MTTCYLWLLHVTVLIVYRSMTTCYLWSLRVIVLIVDRSMTTLCLISNSAHLELFISLEKIRPLDHYIMVYYSYTSNFTPHPNNHHHQQQSYCIGMKGKNDEITEFFIHIHSKKCNWYDSYEVPLWEFYWVASGYTLKGFEETFQRKRRRTPTDHLNYSLNTTANIVMYIDRVDDNADSL